MKMSSARFVSPAARLDALEAKTTNRPSALIAESWLPMLVSPNELPPFAWPPPLLRTLARVVVPVRRSRTNTSFAVFVSCATRVEAIEVKTTRRPSALIATS